MRPLFALTLLDIITETIPFKLAGGNRAAQFYFTITDPDDLPIAFAGSAFDKSFLTDRKRIGVKYNDISFFD